MEREEGSGVVVRTEKYWRVRFYSDSDDFRPVKFPPTGPYWCSGYDSNNRAILIAYLRKKSDLKKYWPEAEIDEWYGKITLDFSERFPPPKWWSQRVK